MSVSRAELAAMRSAGWEVHSYTFWDRLRAVFGRRSPVGRVWLADRVPVGPVVGVNREQRQLVRALRPAPVHQPSLGRALAGWVWRHAAELTVLVLLVWAWHWSTGRIGPHETTAAAVGLVLVVAGVGPVRRVVVALVWCSVTHHRLHVGLVEVRATTRDGRLPLFLSVVPAPFGERVRLWCRAGVSAEDIEDESDRLRAALWCQDVRVIRDRRRSALVTVEVVRRDPLAGRPVRSALLDQLDGERGAR